MRVVGVVAEYNPFHFGHEYHIKTAGAELNARGVVAVMSGNFVQRGEPAAFDKWSRAFYALNCGVDLVIELPTLYATASAEYFARGAVALLESTGIVDAISFGSECGNIELLRHAADILETEPPVFKTVLQEKLKDGKPYAAARQEALCKTDKDLAALLDGPNNILAISYLRALRSKMEAHTVCRIGAGYLEKEETEGFLSALAIREKLERGESVTDFLPYSLHETKIHTMKDYADYVKYALLTTNLDTFKSIPENVRKRFQTEKMEEFDTFCERVKTKNISMASVKRGLLQILLGNTLPQTLAPTYIRVLGFTPRGAELLKEMKKTATLPIVTRPAGFKTPCPIMELDRRATDVYFLPQGRMGEDIKRAPVQIKG